MSRAHTLDAVRRIEDMLIEEGDPVAIYICRMLIIQIASQLAGSEPFSFQGTDVLPQPS